MGTYLPTITSSSRAGRQEVLTLADGVWTLTREAPDFTSLDFRQRFTTR